MDNERKAEEIIKSQVEFIKEKVNNFLKEFENTSDLYIDYFSSEYEQLVKDLKYTHMVFQVEITKCKVKLMINRLNEIAVNVPELICDEDLIEIKTGGNDQYSSWRKKKLEAKIIADFGQQTLNEIDEFKFDELIRDRVMRWVLRGCNVKLAVIKTKFDKKRSDEYQKRSDEYQKRLNNDQKLDSEYEF